ncbi:MAG: hypothetical protein VB142_03110 [Burkholderia sp.]
MFITESPPRDDRIMLTQSTLLFMPGTSDDIGLWRPPTDRLESTAEREIFVYPGFGGGPPIRRSAISTACWHASSAPSALIVQSDGRRAGGARRARQARADHAPGAVPDIGRRVDMAGLGAQDCRGDLSERLPTIAQPALLIWGDDDPYQAPRRRRRMTA